MFSGTTDGLASYAFREYGHDAKLYNGIADLQAKLAAAESALSNVYMLARRERRREIKSAKTIAAWVHVIRFCEEVGCESSILRSDAVKPPERAE